MSNVAFCMFFTQYVYLSKSNLWPRKPRISTDSAESCASPVWFNESSLALAGKAMPFVCLLARAAAATAAAGAGESAGGMLTARTESQGMFCCSVCSSGWRGGLRNARHEHQNNSSNSNQIKTDKINKNNVVHNNNTNNDYNNNNNNIAFQLMMS